MSVDKLTVKKFNKAKVKELYSNDFDGFKKWVKSISKGVTNDELLLWFNQLTDAKLETKKTK